MDGKFASLKSLLELSEKLDHLPETTAIKVQKTLLSNKLQSAFEDFHKLGVSLPDLFAKFQGQLYKSEVISAQDRLKNKEQETGGEPLLTDLINEDMIQDMYTRLNVEDFDTYEKFRKFAGKDVEPPGVEATEEEKRAYQKLKSDFVR
jgi:hypothetical protein